MKDDYPLYVKWRYIVEYILDISSKYPKNVRFNLVDRLTNISLDVIELLVEAIYAKNKTQILHKTNLDIEKIRVLLQISVNKRYISLKQYGYISCEIDEAGKMLGGWLKQCKE